MNSTFIRNLEHRLKNNLPGQNAQYKMAPAARIPLANSVNSREASVLILIYKHDQELWTFFIRRSVYPGIHSGQVSFPGGKRELTDESAEHTALRESYEETGIDCGKVRIIGKLTPLHIPVSNLDVLPFVGYSATQPVFSISKREVEYIIRVPLKVLLKENIITETDFDINGEIVRVPGYVFDNEYIWGATAMILSEFIEVAKTIFPANFE